MSIWQRFFGKKDSKPRETKLGAMGECPHCGATIPVPKKKVPEYAPANAAYVETFSFKCPRCGKEIHSVFTSEPAE